MILKEFGYGRYIHIYVYVCACVCVSFAMTLASLIAMQATGRRRVEGKGGGWLCERSNVCILFFHHHHHHHGHLRSKIIEATLNDQYLANTLTHVF